MTYSIKKIIPLQLRIHVGPIIAYLYYYFSVHIKRNPFIPKVLSIEETLHHIIKNDLSVVRFGDGELSLIDNANLSFQDKNSELAKRLQNILQSNHKKLLICVLNIWDNKIIELEKKVYWFELHHFLKHNKMWERLLSPNLLYGDAFITRPYLTIRDKKRSRYIFDTVKSIWLNKDVVLIEGEKSRLGVGNDLFSGTKSLQRILCPSENAYSKYAEIKRIAFTINKNSMVLISLGPTAKPLAYDMFLAGYRVLDIGHIDMEYEMFLRQKPTLTKVPYKYFNEINERNPEECNDETYLRQIVSKIT